MLTTTGYLRNFRVFGILAVLAAILTVLCRPAVTNAMRALLIVCHRNHPSNRVYYIRPLQAPETTAVHVAAVAELAACAEAGASRRFATGSLRNECVRPDYQSQTIHQPQLHRL